MPGRHLASTVFALALAPAGCVVSTTCDEPGALCLAADDVLTVRVGVLPDAIALADLDRDGTRDVVVASSTAGTLSVLWGRPGAPPDTTTTWSIDQEVAGVVVADLDGDGRLDLATAMPRSDSVAVVRGCGGREFAGPERHSAGATPRALIAADLDGDARPELVTADLGSGTVSVLREFIAGPPIVVGSGPRALAAGDVDGDGHVDLAVALADADALQVLRGDGQGKLSAGPLHPVGTAPYAVVIADLDGDGALDLASADSLDDSVSVLWGDGHGDVRDRSVWPTAGQPSALALVTPAEGLPVLGVLSEATSTIEQLDPRDGTRLAGATAEPVLALAVDGETMMTAAYSEIAALTPGPGLHVEPQWEIDDVENAWLVDLDGDGVQEILYRETGAESGVLSLRHPDGAVIELHTGLEMAFTDVVSGDLTDDGRPDLVVSNGQDLALLEQQVDGEFVAAKPVPRPLFARDLALGDVDGDGALELLVLVSSIGTNALETWDLIDGQLLQVNELSLAEDASLYLNSLTVLDADGDGRIDLAIDGTRLDGVNKVYYLEDAASPARELEFPGAGIFPPTFRDIDGDGALDAIVCTGERLLVVRDYFSGSEDTRDLGLVRCADTEVADLDGDGTLDLLTYTYSASQSARRLALTPWLRDGDTWTRRGGHVVEFEATSSLIVPGFTVLPAGDSLEFLWFDGKRLQRSTGSFAPALVADRLANIERPSLRLGDVDGDGAADLLGQRGGFGVAFADGAGGFSPMITRDLGEVTLTEPVFADFDADGVAELVMLRRDPRQDGSELVAMTVDRDGTFTADPLAVLPPGASGMSAADLDGDGTLDLLAFDQSGEPIVHVLSGRGDGWFADAKAFALPDRLLVHALHDVDRDGYLDLIGRLRPPPAETWAAAPGLYVFPGRATGGFDARSKLAEVSPGASVAGDFNRDGALDLFGIGPEQELLWIGGVVTVRPTPPRAVLAGVGDIAAADLDGDGHPELIAAVYEHLGSPPRAGNLHIARSNSDGSFAIADTGITSPARSHIEVADIDGDGSPEIALNNGDIVTIVRQRR